MTQQQVRFRVLQEAGKHGQKPVFERILTLNANESSDSDLIVRALRKLFGQSVTINVEYYAI